MWLARLVRFAQGVTDAIVRFNFLLADGPFEHSAMTPDSNDLPFYTKARTKTTGPAAKSLSTGNIERP